MIKRKTKRKKCLKVGMEKRKWFADQNLKYQDQKQISPIHMVQSTQSGLGHS